MDHPPSHRATNTTHGRFSALRKGLLASIVFALALPTFSGETFKLLDRDYIENAPLEAKVLTSKEEGGIVYEEVEFNGCLDRKGKPIRTYGRLYHPKNGKNLPVILWCEGGMSDARKNGIALILAKKGYLTISINLPKKEWGSHEPFNTEKPADANFIRFATTYMRAITYLLSQPEADRTLVAIGGASYGGVFSTLVSGLDPRILAGMSFFSAGNHRLGSNLPQFTSLKDLKQVNIFSNTGDGAYYQKKRYIPFLWGVAANDNWFYFPAVTQTYRDAQSPGKRLAITPLWEHGFPEQFDQQLFDWFDIHLKKTRKPYNMPGKMELTKQNNQLVATWHWTGNNKVKKAELVVSYGLVLPWHGWIHRMHHVMPATISGNSANMTIPVPEADMDMLIYGNTTDENGVLVSTDPIVVKASDFGVPATKDLAAINTYPWGDFSDDTVYFFERYALMKRLGELDNKAFKTGKQSLRIPPGTFYRKKKKPIVLKLYNVYARSHKLKLWVKADQNADMTIQVKGLPPRNWERPAVQAILAAMPRSFKSADKGELPLFKKTVSCKPEWQEIELDCPFNGRPVEGYDLEILFPPNSKATYWIDDIRFLPQWKPEK